MESIIQLELFISCRTLDDLDTTTVSDPFVVVYSKNDDNNWVKIGRTELIWNNLNPNFAESIKIEYHFEMQQYLKFEVHHFVNDNSSKIIGSAQATVSSIAGSKDQILMTNLTNDKGKQSGKLIVKADQVKKCNDDITIHISGHQIIETRFWFWHGTNPFLRFYRLRKDDANPVLVYQTEHLLNNKNPVWKPIQCKAQKLCNGDYQMPLKIELWDFRTSGQHLYLGECSLSIEQLQQSPQGVRREMRNKQKNNSLVGSISFSNFCLRERPSFWDFIAGGLQLNLIVAIDYTASNKPPQDPKSLHYNHPDGRPSQYLQALISVGEILINYDYDKRVPVYGFGAKPFFSTLNTTQTLHCFPLNDNIDDPEVFALDGIVQAYRSTVARMQFDGPTYLHPVLSEAMKMAKLCKDQGSNNYLILLVLTDGETHDMQASIDDVIASSHLPLSIIIIGIGTANFANMEKIDNDDMSMVDSNGRKAQRDLVQFVPFENFKGDAVMLAKEVLAELPDQVVEYMELMKIKPKPPTNVDRNNFYAQQMQGSQHTQQQQPQQYQPAPPGYGQGFNQQQLNQGPPGMLNYNQLRNPMESTYAPTNPYPPPGGVAVQVLGQGMAKQGFLNGFVQQANKQNFNYPA